MGQNTKQERPKCPGCQQAVNANGNCFNSNCWNAHSKRNDGWPQRPDQLKH